MTSGLAWPELSIPYGTASNPWGRMFASPDPYPFVLEQPLAATAGTVWNYNSGGVELLGAILTKVAKRPLNVFAKKALFDPLGIKDSEWTPFANGAPVASAGLELRPRDLAKIGQLVLNRGIWHGHRIVSAAWIKAMTARQIPGRTISIAGKTHALGYGYLWWLGDASIDNRKIAWTAGFGYAGQRLYVVPSADLVVAATAGLSVSEGSPTGKTALDMALRATMRN